MKLMKDVIPSQSQEFSLVSHFLICIKSLSKSYRDNTHEAVSTGEQYM